MINSSLQLNRVQLSRALPLTVLVLGCVTLAGCVRSEKSAYAQFLGHRIDASPATTTDLAMAFGLDGHEPPALASVNDLNDLH